MIIQHNIMSLNAHRQLSGNTNQVSKNLEKLSSGYRINRAGDDAAGLAISEKMRSQIKSLDRAKMNAQDGISLVQTAEGALTETHSMLNRLVDLATESANGTIQADDRQKIQSEVEALTGEIDRISQATNFNGINLLDGSLGGGSGSGGIKGASVTVNPLIGAAATATAAKAGVYKVAMTAADKDGTAAFTIKDGSGALKTITIDVKDTNTAAEMAAALKKTSLGDMFEITGTATDLTFTAKTAGKTGQPVVVMGENKAVTAGNETKLATVTTAAADSFMQLDVTKLTAYKSDGTLDINKAIVTINGVKFGLAEDAAAVKKMQEQGITAVINGAGAGVAAGATALIAAVNAKFANETAVVNATATTIDFKAQEGSTSSGGGLTMQVGETADSYNKVTVSVANMGSGGLGVQGLDLGTQEGAAAALQTIKSAVETVSVARGTLGALQNRLEHTINNLGVTSENMTAAESRIRDVDMAKEMMDFTKNNVLSQAAQAMLAQANQQPQQVLQLLR